MSSKNEFLGSFNCLETPSRPLTLAEKLLTLAAKSLLPPVKLLLSPRKLIADCKKLTIKIIRQTIIEHTFKNKAITTSFVTC